MSKIKSWESLFSEISIMIGEKDCDYKVAYQINKQMIKSYVSTSCERGANYDHVNIGKLVSQIKKFPIEYREGLFVYLKQTLKQYNIICDADKIDKEIWNDKRLKVINNKKLSFWWVLRYLHYNPKLTGLILIIVFMSMSFPFIPAPIPELGIFQSKTLVLSEIPLINGMLNLLCYLFFDIDGVEIVPSSGIAVMSLLLMHGFFAIIIVNYFGRIVLGKIGGKNVD